MFGFLRRITYAATGISALGNGQPEPSSYSAYKEFWQKLVGAETDKSVRSRLQLQTLGHSNIDGYHVINMGLSEVPFHDLRVSIFANFYGNIDIPRNKKIKICITMADQTKPPDTLLQALNLDKNGERSIDPLNLLDFMSQIENISRPSYVQRTRHRWAAMGPQKANPGASPIH